MAETTIIDLLRKGIDDVAEKLRLNVLAEPKWDGTGLVQLYGADRVEVTMEYADVRWPDHERDQYFAVSFDEKRVKINANHNIAAPPPQDSPLEGAALDAYLRKYYKDKVLNKESTFDVAIENVYYGGARYAKPHMLTAHDVLYVCHLLKPNKITVLDRSALLFDYKGWDTGDKVVKKRNAAGKDEYYESEDKDGDTTDIPQEKLPMFALYALRHISDPSNPFTGFFYRKRDDNVVGMWRSATGGPQTPAKQPADGAGTTPESTKFKPFIESVKDVLATDDVSAQQNATFLISALQAGNVDLTWKVFLDPIIVLANSSDPGGPLEAVDARSTIEGGKELSIDSPFVRQHDADFDRARRIQARLRIAPAAAPAMAAVQSPQIDLTPVAVPRAAERSPEGSLEAIKAVIDLAPSIAAKVQEEVGQLGESTSPFTRRLLANSTPSRPAAADIQGEAAAVAAAVGGGGGEATVRPGTPQVMPLGELHKQQEYRAAAAAVTAARVGGGAGAAATGAEGAAVTAAGGGAAASEEGGGAAAAAEGEGADTEADALHASFFRLKF